MSEHVGLGDKVRDRVTRIEGIVVGRYEYLYGCTRICIQQPAKKDQKPPDGYVVDEPQCEVIKRQVVKPAAAIVPPLARTGGPSSYDPPSRSHGPTSRT